MKTSAAGSAMQSAMRNQSHAKHAYLAPRIVMFDPLATVPYYTAYLSRALLEAGAKVEVASITYYLDPTCFSSRKVALRPGVLNIVGRYALSRRVRQIAKVAELAINLSARSVQALWRPPDILHLQFLPLLRGPLPLDLAFARLCRRRGSALVLTVHDLMPHDTAERYKALFTTLYQGMDALICHSEHVRTRLTSEFGVAAEKVAVIPHGPFFFDAPNTGGEGIDARLGIPEGSPVVLWQGIIFPYKGLDVLLDAWQLVEQRHSAAWLVVVGTGDPQRLADVREQVQRLGLRRVALDLRFASTEELVASYHRADVVVYPYRAITTSGALATGLALGKAIVASDLPVLRELLTNGENALLVTPASTEALATALLTLVTNDELRASLSARVAAMKFGDETWRSIAERTISVYRDALERT